MPELRLEVGGTVFRDWTRARIVRNLSEISGSFELEYDDQDRASVALPSVPERRDLLTIKPPAQVRLLLDGELVLLGRLDDVDFEVRGDDVRARMAGRDMTGWLVDCSANPNGPAEYKGLTVTEIASRLCAPFGIAVRAEVDVGAPLRDFGIELGESVMSVIDKAAKQRAVLVTSDGVGGLVLTRSGTRRAPAMLAQPGNALSLSMQLSVRERYSDYWVKGQARPDRAGRRARLGPGMVPTTLRLDEDDETASHSRRPVASPGPQDGAASPSAESAPSGSADASRQSAIISTGHAVDHGIPGYRPRVFSVRTQSGGAPNQLLAEWRLRIARGRSNRTTWSVAGWRDGKDNRLWRPNELVTCKIDQEFDQLIAGVSYHQDAHEGSRTELELVGREAFDLEPLPDQHRRHAAARGSNVGRIDRLGGRSGR